MNDIFTELETVITQRLGQSPESSYVAKLNHQGLDKILKKIGEESAEVIIASKGNDKQAIVYESCDLLFHLMVLLANKGIQMDDIRVELQRRFGLSGLTEKANRNRTS